MVNMARRVGIEAFGVDLISKGPGKEHWFIQADLSRPLLLAETLQGYDAVLRETWEEQNDPDPTFELITCLEVAEHIPADSSEVLVDTIARHLRPEGILIFSSAPPGQSGEHHVNCRPAWEWKSMFYERGVSYREDLTRQLSLIWSLVAGPMQWLSANVQVFDS